MGMIRVRSVYGDEGRDLCLDPREIAAVEEVTLVPTSGDVRPVAEVTLKGGSRFLVDMAASEFMETYFWKRGQVEASRPARPPSVTSWATVGDVDD